jgi:hypothetical protein
MGGTRNAAHFAMMLPDGYNSATHRLFLPDRRGGNNAGMVAFGACRDPHRLGPHAGDGREAGSWMPGRRHSGGHQDPVPGRARDAENRRVFLRRQGHPMKARIPFRLVLLAGAAIGLGLPAAAFAGEAGKVQALQRVIDAQQRQLERQQQQLEAQQRQLDAQRRLLQEVQEKLTTLAGEADPDGALVDAGETATGPPAARTRASPEKADGLSQATKHDRDSPTGANVTYFDTGRRVNIPGTTTDIGLHGLVQFQILHDSDGLDNNRFDTATIPVDGAPSQTKFSVNPTRFGISSATPVSDGRVNTMISMDFNGELDRPDPRLRIAYGEFVSADKGWGILAGQAYSTMNDLQAAPETLDFAGPAALWQTRQPLLRFTKAITEDMFAEFSFETPENVVYLNAETTEKLTRWPDVAAAGTWRIGSDYIKHIRVAGLVRDLGAEGANGVKDSALGWAVAGSTKTGLPFLGAKDNLKFTIHYGDGYGTQIKGGPAEGAFNDATSTLETIKIFGTYGGIQHFWSDSWRSNLVYGYVNADNPEFLGGDIYDNTNYVAADLIWYPYKNVSFGFEYLWGRRENKDGASGTSNRYLFSTRYDF